MSDPLTQIVGLLQPNTSYSKLVLAAGSWAVRRTDDGQPFYCAVLDGSCRLAVMGREPIALRSGDFVLVPSAHDFVMSSVEPPCSLVEPDITEVKPGIFRIGAVDAPIDVRILIGHCAFASDSSALLVSLLPQLIHVRGDKRLLSLVELVNDETRAERPGRDVVLARLLEVLLIETLRLTSGPASPPGLLRGLGDDHLAVALREMHEHPDINWSMAALAKSAALSRSTFFDRFRREVGSSPMEYLLGWRMALAKDMLRQGGYGVAQVAERVGYSSASTFSIAFSRHVGEPPRHYARGVP